jgi:hypothetical protein
VTARWTSRREGRRCEGLRRLMGAGRAGGARLG